MWGCLYDKKKNEEKRHPSTTAIILITDRHSWYIYVGLQPFSLKLAFYLLFGYYRRNDNHIYGYVYVEKIRKQVSTSPLSTILITKSQIWYVCVGLHLSSKMPFYPTPSRGPRSPQLKFFPNPILCSRGTNSYHNVKRYVYC